MTSITSLLNEEGFLKNLFQSIPCGVLICDGNRKIQAINNVLEKTFGISSVEAINKLGGEALNCIHESENPNGCGFSEHCRECSVRKTTIEALKGKKIRRNKAKIELSSDGKTQEKEFLISAAPVIHESQTLAIIMLEDISELSTLRQQLKVDQGFSGIIGRDASMSELYETIREIAPVNIPVLIQGESGTGKELVASAIHNEGPRAKKLFVPVNCGALPEGLLESELFGHIKGAFTGAVRDKKGRFELADGGTLFLDEIGDLPKVVQVKLLRVLQEGKFERVGGEKTISVDIRIISATNRDLKREVENGNFRDDLYYRVKVVPIHLPPLRKRKNDIPLLIDHFLAKSVEQGQKFAPFSTDAHAMMMDYSWPGNVRELQSAIRYALVKAKGESILPKDLPMELIRTRGERPSRGPSLKLDLDRVQAALIKSGGNKAKASRLLGVGRATLYRFLTKFPDVS